MTSRDLDLDLEQRERDVVSEVSSSVYTDKMASRGVEQRDVVSEASSSVYSTPSAPVDVKSEATLEQRDPTEPTEEELATLPRVPGRLPLTAHTIAFVEMCEHLSFCGTISVFVNFIQQPLPEGSVTGAGFDGQSGALGLGQRLATAITTFDSMWVYLVPLVGGYMADAHWGRYTTILYACFLSIVGHLLLILSSVPVVIVNGKSSMALLMTGIIVTGLGTGSIKANVGTLMAEQSADARPTIKVLKDGKRVIIDPELTVSRSYLYLYLMLNVAAVSGETAMVYAEKYVGFWLAFTIPLCFFLTSPFVLWWGRKRYVRSPPSGSVLSKAIRLWRLATKGQWSINPVTTCKNLKNPLLWERVKPSNIPPDQRPAWMTFDDSWVDEVARGVGACKVLAWFPVLWLGYNQMLHNLTSQAATMQTHGLPNDFYSNVNPFTLIVFIPLFDQFVYPFLRDHNINFSPLRRMATGFLLAALALIWCAVLQHYIYSVGPCGVHANSCPPGPLSVWLQAPAFSLIALSEMMAVTTGMEYCFAKAPTNMRSLVYAVYLSMTAIAALAGQAFVPLSDDPLLVWNYGVISVLLLLGTVGFSLCFRKLDGLERRAGIAGLPPLPTEGAVRDLEK